MAIKKLPQGLRQFENLNRSKIALIIRCLCSLNVTLFTQGIKALGEYRLFQ